MKKIYVKTAVLAASIVVAVSFATSCSDDYDSSSDYRYGSAPPTVLSFTGKQVVDYSVWVGDPVNGGTLVSSGTILPENVFGSVYQELVADDDNKMLGTYTLTAPDLIVYASPSLNEQNTYQMVGDTLFVQGFVYAFASLNFIDKRVGLLHFASASVPGATSSSSTYATLEQGLTHLGYTSLADMMSTSDTIAIYNVSYMYESTLPDPDLPEQPSQPQPYSKNK